MPILYYVLGVPLIMTPLRNKMTKLMKMVSEGKKNMLNLELNTFDPTYFNFTKIQISKMSIWELKYQNGASPTLKVTAPFSD